MNGNYNKNPQNVPKFKSSEFPRLLYLRIKIHSHIADIIVSSNYEDRKTASNTVYIVNVKLVFSAY